MGYVACNCVRWRDRLVRRRQFFKARIRRVSSLEIAAATFYATTGEICGSSRRDTVASLTIK